MQKGELHIPPYPLVTNHDGRPLADSSFPQILNIPLEIQLETRL